MTHDREGAEMTAARRKFTHFQGDGSTIAATAGVGTLESDLEERVLADGGRRHSESRGVATEDGGRRTSHRVWRINGLHGHRGDQSRERVSEGQGFSRSEDREGIREGSDHRCRVPTGRASEDVRFSRNDSRRVSEDLGHRRSVSQERVRGDRGHRPSNSWERVRGDRSSDVSLSEVGSHPTSDSGGTVREDRGLHLSGTWEGVRELRGPRTSDSGERGSDDHSRRLSGSWEGGSVDGGRSLSNSWEEGVSEDRGYVASDSSVVSVSEDASRRRFWERESEDEGSRCRGSWERTTEDGVPGPSDDEEDSRCCTGSWVTASEDRRSSRGLDSTPPRSPRGRTMPGVSGSGPFTFCTETATPRESDYFTGPHLCHTPFLTSAHRSFAPSGSSLSHLSLLISLN